MERFFEVFASNILMATVAFLYIAIRVQQRNSIDKEDRALDLPEDENKRIESGSSIKK